MAFNISLFACRNWTLNNFNLYKLILIVSNISKYIEIYKICLNDEKFEFILLISAFLEYNVFLILFALNVTMNQWINARASIQFLSSSLSNKSQPFSLVGTISKGTILYDKWTEKVKHSFLISGSFLEIYFLIRNHSFCSCRINYRQLYIHFLMTLFFKPVLLHCCVIFKRFWGFWQGCSLWSAEALYLC